MSDYKSRCEIVSDGSPQSHKYNFGSALSLSNEAIEVVVHGDQSLFTTIIVRHPSKGWGYNLLLKMKTVHNALSAAITHMEHKYD